MMRCARTGLVVVTLVCLVAAVGGGASAAPAAPVPGSGAGSSPLHPGGAGSRQPQSTPGFTIEQILAPAYAFELVSARAADRIAWISYERGMRNVYTAAAPDFTPVRLTANEADDGVDLTSLRISDDGSIVVFVRGHDPNREGWVANPTSDPRGGERSIWAARTAGGNPWKLVIAGDPVLSPNGRWVAFDRDGQIYRVPVDPALASSSEVDVSRPLFRAWGDNSDPVWSPDGRKIAFVSRRGDHSFVAVYDTEVPGVTYMAPGVDYDSSPTWSPDGTRVAFIRRPGAPFGRQIAQQGSGSRGGRGGFAQGQRGGGSRPGLTDAAFADGSTISFWVADAETGEGHEIWHDQAGDDSFDNIRRIEWASSDLVFQAEPGNWRHWYSVAVPDVSTSDDEEEGGSAAPPAPVSDAAPVDLTPGDGIAEYVGLSADGTQLYWAGNVSDIDRRHIWRTPTAGGEPVQLTRGDEIETYPAPLASGERVAVLTASAFRPLSVGLVAGSGGATEVIFPELSEEFPLDQQVVPENVVLTAADGLEFHNQVFVPRDIQPGERRPAVLFTHGGPVRQMLLGYHYMHFYHMAYAINQYFANQGYVVISVNYRSGIGYGQAFRNAENRGRRGNSEYQDVLAAGQYLQQRPDVDPERIGLWGLSYGGILTAQGLARNSDIFAAGVDIAGVHLWGNTIEPDDVSYQSSSVSEIDKWTSPVLLIHGDDDRNVAFSQTTGLVQLLRAHDVYYELIVFPDDVHDSLLFSRWLTTFNAADDFFRRFLREREMTQQ